MTRSSPTTATGSTATSATPPREIGTLDLIVFIDPAAGEPVRLDGRARRAEGETGLLPPTLLAQIMRLLEPASRRATASRRRCWRDVRGRCPGPSRPPGSTPVDGPPAGVAAGAACRSRSTVSGFRRRPAEPHRAGPAGRRPDARRRRRQRAGPIALVDYAGRGHPLRGLGAAAPGRQHPAPGRAAARPGAAADRRRQRDQLDLRGALGAAPRAGAAAPPRQPTTARPSSSRTSATSSARR